MNKELLIDALKKKHNSTHPTASQPSEVKSAPQSPGRCRWVAGVLSTHDPRLHRPSLPGSVTDACTSKMYSSKSRSAALLTAERPPEVGGHWARRGRDSPGLAVAVRAG